MNAGVSLQPVYVDSIGNTVLFGTIPNPLGPTLGTVYSIPLDNGEAVIQFQMGNPETAKRNGVTNEALISIVMHHIAMQNRALHNEHNINALRHLNAALTELDARQLERRMGHGFKIPLV